MSTGPLVAGEVTHFVGIGGIGMSGLALVLRSQGQQVSGSDLGPNQQTQRLEASGISVFYGHRADNLKGVTRLVFSSAIQPDNPELLAARTGGITIAHRAQVLAQLAEGYRMIGVSGTHGKTTTSSLIAVMLYNNGLDPTVLVGGEVDEFAGNARLGKGPHLVAEVDESDGSLVLFSPEVAVITNIEGDHLDHYRNLNQIVEAFQQFARQSRFVVGCLDCQTLRDNIDLSCSYSLEGRPGADYTVDQVSFGPQGTSALILERGAVLGELHLKLLGRHNLSNALAAVAVGRHLGLSFEQIAASIRDCKGAHRRFQRIGERNDILFVDDYAHHPSEVRATLAAARLQGRRVVAVFQPHRYSRSHLLLDEFGPAFGDADLVVLTEIYAAGETNANGISGTLIASTIGRYHPDVHFEATLEGLKRYLEQTLRPGDLALFLGAGNLNRIIPELLEQRAEPSALAL
ncbi:UDP-N-acetylmuramate--L-alanine ligase [Gloeobacter kilaueensis]|uniref:UDP-N-acetylmuramate--L-alanine ligase n=1 Tax=Gloeobacter kilaueensis (strain ATCC BAA-2537 / CCAP 1431/1 / ULC 316 / JS1) TaxID=1183438 RepID=U5QM34_GLOK1|nr:UDP-N-acetylmuramate--L-alanine ligase [Gloeobacter kilaueensis]AGY58740.1 UDP-N-acetylmuramate--L-alanine ligase [Gloeobacter kilaueensis JS1]